MRIVVAIESALPRKVYSTSSTAWSSMGVAGGLTLEIGSHCVTSCSASRVVAVAARSTAVVPGEAVLAGTGDGID
jgi:hypothetical protein